MARGSSSPGAVAAAYLTLRRARHAEPEELAASLDRAQQQLEEAFEGESISKSDAARHLGVSSQTLNAWLARDLIPTVTVDRYARRRIPLRPLLALAAEVDALRDQGRQRGLLTEALSRLEAEDERWQEAIAPLLSRAQVPFDRGQYVPARREGWHPED